MSRKLFSALLLCSVAGGIDPAWSQAPMLEPPDNHYFVSEGSWGQKRPDQWALQHIGFDASPDSAWRLVKRNAQPVIVAVIDTGLDWNHRNIASENIWSNPREIAGNGIDDDKNGYVDDIMGWDFVDRDNRPWDYSGHGTFVAGVLRCMAPGADVRVEGFLTHGGAIYESEIVQQLNDSLDDMPDIISMSAGCTTRNNLPLLGFQVLWEQRLQYLKGTAVVVAAGNDRSRKPFWPAAFPWAVSVGALERDGSRARFSNFGSWVDVYALGGNVVNAYPNGTYRYREPPESDNGKVAQFVNAMSEWSGTSFSTPLVAGIIAARMSHMGESGRQAADAALRIARSHAEPGIGAIAEPGMACDPDPGCGCRD